MVVRHRPERPPDGGLGEEHREPEHEDRPDHRGDDVELAEKNPLVFDDVLRDPDVEPFDVAPPQGLAEPFEEEREPDGGHEQDERVLVHEGAQHHPLDDEGEDDHDDEGQHDRDPRGDPELHQPDEGEGREQHHHPLGEVEDLRRLEDEHEAEGDEGVHHPGEQAVHHHLGEEDGGLPHLDEGGDEDRGQDFHACTRAAGRKAVPPFIAASSPSRHRAALLQGD